MKIAIIGAGAMGSLYGGYLSKSGEEVYLVDIWQEHIDKINKNGLIIKEEDRELITYPKATTNASEIGIIDLVIVFVKSTLTREVVENNRDLLGHNTLVMSLQNGYGNIEQIERYVKRDNIIAGTTSHGAIMIGPGKISHAGRGDTCIGWVGCNKSNSIDAISKLLHKSGFNTIISNNVMELVWKKLIVNAGINALTAILEVKNGELLNEEDTRTVMTMAIEEAVDVAEAAGIKLNKAETVEKVMKVAIDTANNKSSMLQDILNKRKTEIDTINGAIVQEGKRYWIKTPVNQVLYNLIKAKENQYFKQNTSK